MGSRINLNGVGDFVGHLQTTLEARYLQEFSLRRLGSTCVDLGKWIKDLSRKEVAVSEPTEDLSVSLDPFRNRYNKVEEIVNRFIDAMNEAMGGREFIERLSPQATLFYDEGDGGFVVEVYCQIFVLPLKDDTDGTGYLWRMDPAVFNAPPEATSYPC